MIGRCRITALMFLACLFTVMLYCVNSGVTDSGGGLDIGNPTKLCVVDSLNRPVADASVKIISSDAWFANTFGGNDVVADSAVTDHSGIARIARIDSLAEGNYNLQVDHPSGGAFIRDFRGNDSAKVNSITIRNYGALSGTLNSTSGTPVRIFLEGTACRADVSSDGSYSFANVAPGLCVPVVMASDSRWTFTKTIIAIASQTIVDNDEISFNSLLIDDFEDSAATAKLGRFIAQSRIYTMHADVENVTADYRIVSGGIDNSRALNASFITRGYWALLGFFLGIKSDADSIWDLHSATGLSFYAKGKGNLNVSFESDTIDKMGFYKHYSADITLDTGWRQYTIPFDSLNFYNDENPTPDITWDEASRSIKRIEFNALKQDTVQLWLDDIKIEGIDFSKVY